MNTGFLNQGRFAISAQRVSVIGVTSLLVGASVLAASVAANASPTQTAGQISWLRGSTRATLPAESTELRAAIQRKIGRPLGDAHSWGENSVTAATGNREGFSVAISGNTAVVGAPGQAGNVGTAYVWEHHEGRPWQQEAALPDPRGASNDEYGWAVAISSTSKATYVAVGSNEQNSKPDVVYIYEGSGKTWHLQATLYDPDGNSTDMFGAAMAISGTVLAIGAPGVSGNSGIVYIYTRSGQVWTLQATETDPGDASNDLFGRSVSTSGTEVLAGGVGISYVFTNASGKWVQTAVLRNPGSASDNFGYAVKLAGVTAVVGAPGGSSLSPGAAYIFTMKGSTWSTPKKLTAPTGTKGDEFGSSVTEAGHSLLIGMPVYGQVNCGTAFDFVPVNSVWTFQGQVLNPNCTQGDEFGFAAALSGTTGVIGAPGTNNGAGAAFFLSLPPTTPETTLQDPGGTGVYAVAFSPNSSTLATGDLNGSTYLWTAGNSTPIATLRSPNGQGVYGAASSPDGNTLAVGTVNKQFNAGSIYLWDVSSGTLAATLHNPGSHGVDTVAFSPDDTTLAAGDDNGNTYLWDVSSGKLMATLSDPASQGVNGVAFTDGGATLATADSNGHAYVWNVATSTLDATLTDPASQGVNGVAFAPNADAATADGNGHVYLWEPPGTLIGTLSDPTNQGVNDIAFNPDGTSLAAATTNQTHTKSDIYVWNVASGSLIATFRYPSSEGAFHLAFSPSGNTLAVGDANDHTYLWDMKWLDS